MIKYNTLPNSNCNTNPILETFKYQKIEKIIWFKKVGEFLNSGDILCEIHYDDCVFEMECEGGNYLLYKNTKTTISFSDVLSVFGEENEILQTNSDEHFADLKITNTHQDPLFEKIFYIENSYRNNTIHLTD